MLANTFNNVDFPDPFRPTTPKNSPRRTSNDTPRNARNSRYSTRVRGRSTRSWIVSILRSGIRKVFSSSRTSITTGPSARLRLEAGGSGASRPSAIADLGLAGSASGTVAGVARARHSSGSTQALVGVGSPLAKAAYGHRCGWHDPYVPRLGRKVGWNPH